MDLYTFCEALRSATITTVFAAQAAWVGPECSLDRLEDEIYTACQIDRFMLAEAEAHNLLVGWAAVPFSPEYTMFDFYGELKQARRWEVRL